MGGVAVASAIVSVTTGAMALSANARAADQCIPERDFCPTDDTSHARTLAWISTGTLLGAAAAGVSLR